MKKIFWLAPVMAIAVSLMGVQLVISNFQTVPVTVAQSNAVEIAATLEPQTKPVQNNSTPTTAPTATAYPTIAPFVTKQPVKNEPAATAIAGASITKAPTRSVEQALLDQFVATVSDQERKSQVAGVYVPEKFSLPVLQQPAGESSFVSTQDGTITQFGSANVYGTIGLLAHNYLSGKDFFDLQAGDEVVIVYGSGERVVFRVTKTARYQALSPTSDHSNFINVADPQQTVWTANQVFQEIYGSKDQVVFQTCIEANGDPSWGRLFVTAEKIKQ